MSDKTAIEWADATWNPTTGCTRVSPGCDNCYIERTPAFRIKGRRFDKEGAGGTTAMELHYDRLALPLKWKRPRRVFVNSLSDLFHEQIPRGFIQAVFAIMAMASEHTFLVLTKRPRRMCDLLTDPVFLQSIFREGSRRLDRFALEQQVARLEAAYGAGDIVPYPFRNVWLGFSVEDQKRADLRIPVLLETPAAVRFLSVEPLLGRVDLSLYLGVELIDWVIVGGESGPNARPMHPDWVRSVKEQCLAAGVPFFFKQWGEWSPIRPTNYVRLTKSRWSHPMFAWAKDGSPYNGNQPPPDHFPSVCVWRVGKKTAGRDLDGQTWDEMPKGADPMKGGTLWT